MKFLHLIFYANLRLWFLDVETNPGSRRAVLAVCRILYSNVQRLARNLRPDHGFVSVSYTVVLWDFGLRYASRLGVAGSRIRLPYLVVPMPRARGISAYIRDGYGAFRQPTFECGCCEMLVFRVCGVRHKLYVVSLYHNPDLDDRNFDCLLASIAAVQAEDVRASFLLVGYLNCHHQQFLGSMTMNRHGVAAFDFITVFGCDPPNSCTWWNTWPPDYWCSWPS